MKLIDLFRAYPGGVAGLADDAHVAVHTLYRVANGEHEKMPVRALDAVSRALGHKRLLGRTHNLDSLTRQWTTQKRAS